MRNLLVTYRATGETRLPREGEWFKNPRGGYEQARFDFSAIALDIYEQLVSEALSGVPSNAVCFFMDGNKWCCVFGDFNNLQESPAGFGDKFDEALSELKRCDGKATDRTSST